MKDDTSARSNMREKKNVQTPLQSMFTGACVAATEVLFPGQILLKMKIASQSQGYVRTPNSIRKFYAGTGLHIGIMTGTTVTQFGVANLLKQILYKNEPESFSQNVVAASVGGASSALLLGPLEQCMVLQSRYATEMNRPVSLTQTAKRYASLFGPRRLGTGIAGVAYREIVFTVTYFALAEKLEASIRESAEIHNNKMLGDIAPLLAPILAAIPGAVVSHPADMIKARMQNTMHPTSYLENARALVQENGVKGLFGGLNWRLARTIPAVIIYYNGKELMSAIFNNGNHGEIDLESVDHHAPQKSQSPVKP